ncbi:MAG: MFS transporter [Chloroflexi bacterium]|nr:MFS transporter [Chloroflexota bacterium]
MSLLWFHSSFPPAIFAVLWLVNLIPATLLATQADHWLAGIIPRGTLGRYLGQRQAIRSIFYVTSFILLGYVLDRFGSQDSVGFTFVFGVAFIAALGNIVIFWFMKDSQGVNVQTHDEISPRGFLEEIRRAKLSNYFLFTSLFQVTVNLSGPLYVIYMLRELHFSYLSFTVVISLEFLARVISAPFWGRYADRVGNIRVISLVSRVIPLIPIFWLFNHDVAYLAIVQMVSGVCWGAFDLCTQSYIYRVAPAPKRLRYIVYNRSLLLLCTAVGGLLGAIFYEGSFPIFGSSILGIFLISGVFRLLVVFTMVPKLIDLAVEFGKTPLSPTFNEETVKNMLAVKGGLYYRRSNQGRFSPGQRFPVEAEGTYSKGPSFAKTSRHSASVPYLRRFYQRDYNPSDFSNSKGFAVDDRRFPSKLSGFIGGLYYSKKSRGEYRMGLTAAGKETTEKTRRDNYRDGLYFDSLRRRKYLDNFREKYLKPLAGANKATGFRKRIYLSPSSLSFQGASTL